MIFCCSENNDLHRTLTASGHLYPRFDDPAGAVAAVPVGGCVLLLADDYPRATLEVTPDLLEMARAKSLRMYIEYPAVLPGLAMGEPRGTEWERVVVSSSFFAPELDESTILALHGCWFVPAEAASPHLVAARVAGYNTAVYGLPEEAHPILFELPEGDILVATSKLSQFVTARYGPAPAWKAIWERILRWLTRSDDLPELSWTPTVGLQAGRDDPLPESAERDALERSVRWFRKHAVYSIDWKKGAIEGFEAGIDYLGRQMQRPNIRGDCTGETAMVFAYDWAITRNPDSRRLAGQILDYVWSAPDYRQDDPASPVYGLNNWYVLGSVFYGDDNARVILPTLAARRLLDDQRWDEHVLRCLLANLRTTGPQGFRKRRLDYPKSFTDGRDWRHYRQLDVVDYSSHYQGYLWAAFLWAYALTGYEPFVADTVNAVGMTVDAYPNWRWTNGLTQEIARILLPLAFLVRIDDTPRHREWLRRMSDALLAQMQPCGAIQEQLGLPEHGDYPPPRSNADYGTAEASLIQANGDPACDLLYTANYAFIGLHEAALATGDERLVEAADRMARFFCRIQVRSDDHRYLDGAWMRSFDYELWEYWGSSADIGWGAWSVESGWTNTWIASTLAMRRLGESLFGTGGAEHLKSILPEIATEMMG